MKFDAKSESKKLDQNQKCKKMKKKEKLKRGWIHAKLVLLAIDAQFSKEIKSIDTQPAVEQNKSICAVTMHPRWPPGPAGALPSPLASTHRARILGLILPIRAPPARHG
jgi:hypothetical protein